MVKIRCRKCKIKKPRSEFNKHKNRKNGLQSRCRLCERKYYQKYRDVKLNRAKHRMRYQENKDRWKDLQLQKDFGITLEDYNNMLDKQNGVCKICGMPETRIVVQGTIASLSVDHDHTTGRVRGLLCNHCNRLLGFANDSAEILLNAADYLQR